MVYQLTLMLGMWISLNSLQALAAAPITLAAAGESPTAEQCAGVAKVNSEQLSAASRAHSECLQMHGASRASFREGTPCSRAECRELHLQMHWAQSESGRINRDCRSRVAASEKLEAEDRQRAQDEQAQLKERQRLFLRINELYEKGKDLVDIASKIDNPAKLIADWVRGQAKQEFDRIFFGANTNAAQKDDLEWDIFKIFHQRSVETLDELTARTPIIGAFIRESHGHLADRYENLRDAVEAFDKDWQDIVHTLPNGDPSRMVRVPYRPAQDGRQRQSTPTRARPQPMLDSNGDCAIFSDSDRSMALLLRQPDQWNALNARCGKAKP